jgi:hypothetical protein
VLRLAHLVIARFQHLGFDEVTFGLGQSFLDALSLLAQIVHDAGSAD